jgi:thiol-disulfide isomerase/thioredoxin
MTMSDKNRKGSKSENDGKKNTGGQGSPDQNEPATKDKPSPKDTTRSKVGQQKRLRGGRRRSARRLRKIIAYGLPSIILLIIIAYVYIGLVKVKGPALSSVFAEGKTVPSFSAPGLNGGTVSWDKGKPTVLAIWAAWCSNCQVEIPKLNKIKNDYPEVNFVSIVTAQGQQPGPKPEQFAASNKISIPIAVDDAAHTLAQAMGVRGLPSLYFINADGTVFKKMEIEVSDGALRAGLEHLKAQASSAVALPSIKRSLQPARQKQG